MDGNLALFERYGFEPSWLDILVGLDQGHLKAQEVAALLKSRIQVLPQEVAESVAAFTLPVKGQVVSTMVGRLVGEETPEGRECSIRRWRYILLRDLVETGGDLRKVLIGIERLWADFEYPKDMKHLIYYMPPTDGYDRSHHSLKENQERLLERTKQFLENEHQALRERRR